MLPFSAFSSSLVQPKCLPEEKSKREHTRKKKKKTGKTLSRTLSIGFSNNVSKVGEAGRVAESEQQQKSKCKKSREIKRAFDSTHVRTRKKKKRDGEKSHRKTRVRGRGRLALTLMMVVVKRKKKALFPCSPSRLNRSGEPFLVVR